MRSSNYIGDDIVPIEHALLRNTILVKYKLLFSGEWCCNWMANTCITTNEYGILPV